MAFHANKATDSGFFSQRRSLAAARPRKDLRMTDKARPAPALPIEDFQTLFETSPYHCIALLPNLQIIAGTESFFRVTMTQRESVIGRNLFDVFPDDPSKPENDGPRNLQKSIDRVLRTGVVDVMPVQKYDIRRPKSDGGAFEVRYWSPITSPVLGPDGKVKYLILRTEDVTDFVTLQQKNSEQVARFNELHVAGQQMELEVFKQSSELRDVNLRLKQANEELEKMKGELERRVAERTSDLNKLNRVLQTELEERKKAEQTLATQGEQLRVTLESLGEAVIVTDADSNIERINRVAELYTGWTRDSVLGENLADVFHVVHESTGQPLDIAKICSMIRQVASEVSYPVILIPKNGNSRPIDFHAAPVIDDEHRVLGTVVTFQDVTDRRHLERLQKDMNLQLERQVRERTAELLASEERFRLLVEGTKDYAIFMLDREGRIASWNPGAERIKGYTAAEIVGRHFSTFYVEADKASGKPADELRLAILNGRYEETGYRVRKDGTLFWANVVITALRDSTGSLRGFSKITRDMTKAREAEAVERRLLQEETARRVAEEHSRALWEERERLRVTLESIGDGVIATDVEGRVQLLNPVAQVMTGWTEDAAHGQSLLEVFDIVNEETRSVVENPAIRALRDGIIVGLANHTVLIAKDGKERPIADSAAPIRDVNGHIIGVVLVFRDMTEAKMLEGQFRQAQKMEAVGRLAGGVAHDFNNLLTVILSYCEYLEENSSLDTSAHESVKEISLAGQRAATLTRQLLAFSRQQILHPEIVDLNEVVIETTKMLGRIIGEDVLFSTKLFGRLWLVMIDQGQMEQVLVNLAVNARDAMPNGGKLTIKTSNIDLDENYSRTYTDVKPGPYVLVAVSDTGCGMDNKTKARMFEPYFTTKEPGKGTGLGLATVFGIVKQSGGHITVYSEPNQGTTFKVYIPRAEVQDANAHEPKVSLPPVAGTETILVVEDEPMVRKLACRILRSNGYTVLEAGNGIEALQMFERHQKAIQLVVTDVVMPKMSGRQLSEEIHRRNPHLKVLFMSGYTDDAVVRHGVLDAEAEFLQKPFSPLALAHKVRDVLDHPASHVPAPIPSEAILLVDDEPAVRKSTAILLRGKGFIVLEAANGEEALKVSSEYPGPLKLTLTDINMPKMSGRQLAERLQQQRPDIQVLFMSGDLDGRSNNRSHKEIGSHFIQKPAPASILIQKIRDILDNKPT